MALIRALTMGSEGVASMGAPRVGTLDESPLLARALADDAAALRALYYLHAPPVRRFLRGLLGCPAAADDGTQETFVRAFRRLSTLRDGDRLAPWLFGIARNVALEQRKKRRRDGPWESRLKDEATESTDCLSSTSQTPETALLGAETARALDAALSRLSEDRRATLLLRIDHGLAYEEIAELLSWSLAKVKVEIHRARQVLRAHIVTEGESR